MTGFEYAAAGLLIQEGFVKEGVELVEAIRDRYDGKKRNPYAEIECGSSYARSMASFALPAVLSGFRFDMTQNRIGFSPVVEIADKPFRCFWAVQNAWGTVEIGKEQIILSVLRGALPLGSYILPKARDVQQITVDGAEIRFAADGDLVQFHEVHSIRDRLVIC